MKSAYNLKYVWMICLVAAMGGLLFGYDWVVIGGAKPFYEAFFGLTDDCQVWRAGWAMSSALAGCLLGAVLSGLITDRLGRKRPLIVAAFMFTLSAVWTALSHSYTSFIIARVIGGVGIGLASNISPMYIAEISPAAMRGKFVSINQLTIVVGILAAQLVNLLIYNVAPVEHGADVAVMLQSWCGQNGWRWMFAAETFPAGVFFVLAMLIPESPRWLIKNARPEDANSILTKIGGTEYAADEIADVERTLKGEHKTVHYSELFKPKLRLVLFLGIFLAVLQQWCGINVIFNYAEEIFEAAGYDVSGMMFNVVITGLVNLAFTFVAIKTVDRWGRRRLMLIGAGGLALIYVVMGAFYFFGVTGLPVLLVVLAAIGCYAMTLAPITWVLLSEIFPNRIRGAAMGIGVSALWIACFLLTLAFKPINEALGAAGSFWLFAGVCLVGFVVLFRFVPETKGKTLEEIENDLGV